MKRIVRSIIFSRPVRFLLALVVVSLFTAMTSAMAEEGMEPGPVPESLSVEQKRTVDPGAGMYTREPETGLVYGENGDVRRLERMHPGAMLPDGRGGYVWAATGRPIAMPDPNEEAGREIKLKVRELADQLFGPDPQGTLASSVALPVSFVNQDDFQQSSSLGRYIAEQMFHECTQRGLPVREYRLGEALLPRGGQGEFLLSRSAGGVMANQQATMLLVGTYYSDRYNVFINARLLRAADGLVLRTGNLVFPQSHVTRTMLANTGLQLDADAVSIRDYDEVTADKGMTEIDLGWDIR